MLQNPHMTWSPLKILFKGFVADWPRIGDCFYFSSCLSFPLSFSLLYVFMRCADQKADDREKRQEAHRFHFDAMWRKPLHLRRRSSPRLLRFRTHAFSLRHISRANKWILICTKTFLFDICQSSSQMWNIYVPFHLFIPVLEVQELQQGRRDTERNPNGDLWQV